MPPPMTIRSKREALGGLCDMIQAIRRELPHPHASPSAAGSTSDRSFGLLFWRGARSGAAPIPSGFSTRYVLKDLEDALDLPGRQASPVLAPDSCAIVSPARSPPATAIATGP